MRDPLKGMAVPARRSRRQQTRHPPYEAGLGLAPLGDEGVAEAVAAGRLLRLDAHVLLPETGRPAKVRHAIATLKTRLAGVA